VTFWGSRQLEVAASAQNSAGTDALTTLMVRRAGVLCRNVYRWGTTADIVCNASGSVR
jgi:hypothetical protein